MTKSFLCTAICCALGTSVGAAADSVFVLPDYHVYAVRLAQSTGAGAKVATDIRRIPAAVTVVNQDEMERLGAYDLTDALAYQSGMIVATRGYDSLYHFVKMRGFDVANENFLVDGRKVYSNTDRLFSPELYGTEQVEVYRGPASVLYGKGSIGGVINFQTKRPQFTSAKEVRVQVGNERNRMLAVDVQDVVRPHVSARLVAVQRGHRLWYDKSDQHHWYIAPSLAYRHDRDTVTVLPFYQRDIIHGFAYLPRVRLSGHKLYGIVPDRFYFGGPDDRYELVQKGIAYEWTHRLGNEWTFHQRGSYRHTKVDSYQISAPYNPNMGMVSRFGSGMQSTAKAYDWDQFFRYHRVSGARERESIIGFDRHQERSFTKSRMDIVAPLSLDEVRAYVANHGGSVTVLQTVPMDDLVYQSRERGIYVSHREVRGPWTWTAGLRRGWYHIREDRDAISDYRQAAWTGELGMVYNVRDTWYPYVHWHNSFEAAANLDKDRKLLPPQTGQEWEIGLRYAPKNQPTQVRVSVFDLRRQNIHRLVPGSSPQYYTNTGEVMSRGMEWEFRTNIGDNVRLLGSYTYTKAKITKDENPKRVGKVFENMPKHMLNLRTDWVLSRYADGEMTMGLGARFFGKQVSGLRDRRMLPAVTVWDASLSYVRGAQSWTVHVRNLFNKKYIVGAEDSWGQPEGFAGQDRTWMLSYIYKW